jgi:hypothetical protein
MAQPATFRSFNTTARRSRSKKADHLTFSTEIRRDSGCASGMINGYPERNVQMQRACLSKSSAKLTADCKKVLAEAEKK